MNTQLVMIYTEGDGCSYSCENVKPFEHESPESALVEFDEKAKAAYAHGHINVRQGDGFSFGGHEFAASTFFFQGTYYSPQILTIQEWFDLPR